MSAMIVTLRLHLDRKDHSRKFTAEEIASLAEDYLEGEQWYEDEYGFEVSVINAEVVVQESRTPLGG